MNESTIENTLLKFDERLQAEVESLFAQMKLLNEQRQRDQERIERYKAEHRDITARVEAALARLEATH